MKTKRWSAFAVVAALLPSGQAGAAGQGQPPQLTPIDELVVYAIDAASYELLRYNFDTDAYVRVGVVTDQNGNVVTDIEGLAMIPHGPDKGLYGTANFYGVLPPRLVKINPLDGTARLYPSGIGFGSVEGLVAAEDPATAEWSLIGASACPALLTISPATGSGIVLVDTDRPYTGLALDPDGILFGVSGDDLWTIDRETGDEVEVGKITDDAAYSALEHAFGDFQPRIKVPSTGGQNVVPDSWTTDGIMFAFDASANRLQIVNPQDANNVVWASSLQSIDCEGFAFTTRTRDPFESIVGSAVD